MVITSTNAEHTMNIAQRLKNAFPVPKVPAQHITLLVELTQARGKIKLAEAMVRECANSTHLSDTLRAELVEVADGLRTRAKILTQIGECAEYDVTGLAKPLTMDDELSLANESTGE